MRRRYLILGLLTACLLPRKALALTWTKTAVTLTGASQTLLAANVSRKAWWVFNPIGNASIDIDPAGGTVAANGARTVQGGNDLYSPAGLVTGAALTGIGTVGQTIIVWEGN